MQGGKKILLVEDDVFFAELCQRFLEEEGFSVVIAIDGEEGLEKLQKEKPDLVILDILLPRMNGYAVLKAIRGNPDKKLANTPVIILSNLTPQEEEKEKCEQMKVYCYMVKASTDSEVMVKRVKEVFENPLSEPP